MKGVAFPGSTVSLYTTIDCSGSPAATGTAAEFASPGIAVSVADNSTTTFYGTATNQTGTSPCSTSSITYTERTSPGPPPPLLNATDPASGANNNNPKIKGGAAVGSTVSLYTTIDCSGSPAGSGTSAELASPGIAVSVVDNSTTTFYGTAANQAGTSSCSTISITYTEITPPPPEAPTFTATDPPSPANHNNPRIQGYVVPDATVKLYKNASCTPAGNPVPTGTAGEFLSPGIAVSVTDNSATTFYATATNEGGTSSCSTSAITYRELTPPPPPPREPTFTATDMPPDTSGPIMAIPARTVKMGSNGTVGVPLSCPASEPGGCAGALSLETLGKVRVSKIGTSRKSRKRKVKLGKSSFQVAGAGSATVAVRLSRKNQRLVRKLKKVRVLASIEARDQSGNARTTNERLTLRAPKRKLARPNASSSNQSPASHESDEAARP